METRHSERVDTSLPVMLHALDGTRVPGVVRNVGTRGLYVRTSKSLTVDSEVVITLDLSRERSAARRRITGVVVHNDQGGIGLYTSDLDELARDTMMNAMPIPGSSKGPCVWYVTHSEA